MMDKQQILETIKRLAASQGYYSRLYNALMTSEESERDAWLTDLAAKNFNDAVDLILYLEG
jgi:hypothetical protein